MLLINCQTLAAGQLSTSVGHWGMSGRRFSLHILPKRFVRIRHYGMLSSSLKKRIISILQEEFGKIIFPERTPLRHRPCPICKTGQLVPILTFDSRDPPRNWQHIAQHIAATAKG